MVTVTGVSLVAGLFWVWADMLPALTWLDNVQLWERVVMVNGVETRPQISLQDALLAVGLIVLFGGVYVAGYFFTSDRVPRGTTVAGSS